MKNLIYRTLLLSLAFTLCFSCRSKAQEHSENKSNHKEVKGHDSDGEGHGKEVKGHDNDANHQETRGEHARDKGEGGEGEEDGTQFSKNQTYDVTKHGVRLVLKYNATTNAFEGTMENITNKAIDRARVEVHLSNGIELGPTKPVTLTAKKKHKVVLKATEKTFKTWSTHAEVGNNEHGSESENKEGHSEREKGEHSEENSKEHN